VTALSAAALFAAAPVLAGTVFVPPSGQTTYVTHYTGLVITPNISVTLRRSSRAGDYDAHTRAAWALGQRGWEEGRWMAGGASKDATRH
jgi:hypothetical protein